MNMDMTMKKPKTEIESFCEEAILSGKSFLENLDKVRSQNELDRISSDARKWHTNNQVFLKVAFQSLDEAEKLKNCGVGGRSFSPDDCLADDIEVERLDIERKVEFFEGLLGRLPFYVAGPSQPIQLGDAFTNLNKIFDRFHLVAQQLKRRYNGRETLEIKDEYDVQNLLHSLLHIDFEDIRAEEWAPSYAGKASRMDFLLKEEKIVVEVKKTRKGLGNGEIGDQLIIDITRYQAHSDCQTLICFVYDPESIIVNPRGLEKDLSRDEKIRVKVVIRP
jgi:hypothetical protein